MDIRRHPETTATTIPLMAVETVLPACRSQWSSDAREVFSGVLRDLNAWCRDNGYSASLNGSTAEEAVRQTWGGVSPCA